MNIAVNIKDAFEKVSNFLNNIFIPVNNLIKMINDRIFAYGRSAGIISGIILILSGVLLAFWGYRLKKIALTVIGFFIGAVIGFYLSGLIKDDNNILPLIMALVLGICCAVMINVLYKAAIIIIGVLSGFSIGFFICGIFDLNTPVTLIASLILGIIGAVLSIKIEKIMFIIITTYYGYLLFKIGLSSVNFFGMEKIYEEIISIAVLIAGIIFQIYEQLLTKKTQQPKTKSGTHTNIE